jgi:hypothetical protein
MGAEGRTSIFFDVFSQRAFPKRITLLPPLNDGWKDTLSTSLSTTD